MFALPTADTRVITAIRTNREIATDRLNDAWSQFTAPDVQAHEVHARSLFETVTHAQETLQLWNEVEEQLIPGTRVGEVLKDAIRQAEVRVTQPIAMGSRVADAEVSIRREAVERWLSIARPLFNAARNTQA